MFCTESCEHGCNATSSGKLIANGNGNANANGLQSQGNSQHQFTMSYAPLSTNNVSSKSEVEPPRLGMCLVTECPEGLSIDCNVPLPNSFNLDEYKNHMICSSCTQFNGGGGLDRFGQPGTASPSANPYPTPLPNPIQPSACSFHGQCCPTGGPCAVYDSQPKPPRSHRQELPVGQGAPMMPQIFCLAPPSSHGCPSQPVYLCSLIPVPQSWNLLPLVQPHHLPQQQLLMNPAQDSQLPMQQLVQYDLSFNRLLTELRKERERSCCELQMPQPLAFQLYAPTVRFQDQPEACSAKREPPCPPAAHCTRSPPQPPSASPSPPATSASSAGLPRARSASPKRSRSCLRNKDLWDSGGSIPGPSPCSATPQHVAGNVCMKCGNCWHCPRCNCSNCCWHPGLVRNPPRDGR
ncbi:pollen-specific leucine-rich repeat extensin-like protein 2 [Drosophila yakuba]|uniref:pollen-specific leucine-rich repeat extensin-like protein 2 n=1 Tax=Drosophila yakuba TaxID=7245 RepID=UPI0019308225|nr:pollen-specific leucine-rich repeat extensin-like protein 2 [Drosophila yakuba]